MTFRSRSREVALQVLFERDHNSAVSQDATDRFIHERLRDEAGRTFCSTLLAGVLSNREAIDQRLAAAAENWRIVRMATVDRNVLRLGAYELLYCPETPRAVALDEAIELARRYGSAESSAFVNGVLDRLRREAEGETEQPIQTDTAAPPEGSQG